MVVRSQLNFSLQTLPTHVKWHTHHQEGVAHLTYLMELYEELKEGPIANLDEVSNFKEKYIWGYGSSDEDGEPSTPSKPEIEGRIAHLKDRAKTTNISSQDKSQLKKEIRHLRTAKTKIEDRMAKFQEQANEAYIDIRSQASLALMIRNLTIEMELEFEYFAYY